MSENPRKLKQKISISLGNTNLSNIDKAIARGEFSSVSDAIEKGMVFFFENRNKTAITKEWLLSPEGKETIKAIMRMED